MAGTAVKVIQEFPANSEVEKLRLAVKALNVDVERLRAALDAVCDLLDADGGVTGTNYASTANVATAGAITAFDVNVHP